MVLEDLLYFNMVAVRMNFPVQFHQVADISYSLFIRERLVRNDYTCLDTCGVLRLLEHNNCFCSVQNASSVLSTCNSIP